MCFLLNAQMFFKRGTNTNEKNQKIHENINLHNESSSNADRGFANIYISSFNNKFQMGFIGCVGRGCSDGGLQAGG